ncbi:DUF4180 domain-containing protein [Actinomycetospora sp. NBRC 106378]|uniref:DUF4180 domain-containing protein n=1 Tax=Actinomycetospora sp. NBRC 106378 TaxID=3032208 RepID=UPI0024A46899|nr:DUF4180 domain-containing protein [Actinomycetospora sp. NBRC 106378]GLZ55252.1 hypothetical protein Acsp07_48690 [Actinomycetospora sp. NBRC 106378]
MANVLTLSDDGPQLDGERAALDLLAEAFGADARTVVVPVRRLAPSFFVLRTGVAGAITQKFVQYGVRLVVLGEPTTTEGPVGDWIREANRGGDLWFVADPAELEARLSR